jgi:hypothetical protein
MVCVCTKCGTQTKDFCTLFHDNMTILWLGAKIRPLCPPLIQIKKN